MIPIKKDTDRLKKIKEILRNFFSIEGNHRQRDKWVISELAQITPGKKILDAGCGSQKYRPYCNHLEYKGQDFAQYNDKGEISVDLDKKLPVPDYVSDIWNIKEADNSFDAILCTEVLEHIPYPGETIKELSRLLKPGGILLLSAPFACLPHMEPYFYFSGFSKEYYRFYLEKYGLEIETITPNGNAFLYVAQESLRLRQFIQNRFLNFVFSILVYLLWVPLLKFFSRIDKVSNNFLVFGYQVKARKKINTSRMT
ncbi:MAG: class I SAM-dependent methyltransferase [Spirochaetales bacterium]|nr:class I SAM-dependent methyltransferase [Spirochaetales bacterium]